MRKEFVTYKIAHGLKELGFDMVCFSAYRNTDEEEYLMGLSDWKNGEDYDNHSGFCAAPLWQQAIDWLELNHGLIVEVNKLRWSGYIYYVKQYNKRNVLCKAAGYEHVATKYDGYSIGIEKALNIIIKRKQLKH